MTAGRAMTNSIMRRLECSKCERRWNWIDPSTPRACPYCGADLRTKWPKEVGKTTISIPMTWPRTAKE